MLIRDLNFEVIGAAIQVHQSLGLELSVSTV